VQEVTGEQVELAYVGQGYTGETAAKEAQAQGMRLEVVKLDKAKKALCCCTVVGWWREVLAGRRNFVVWHEIMSACQRH
jgi:hypothetical protein